MVPRWLSSLFRRGGVDTNGRAGSPEPAARDSASFKREGDAALKAGDLPRAEAHYRQAVACDPANARLHFILGYTLRELGKTAEASMALSSALSADPDLVDAHYVLGLILEAEGRAAAAIGHFRRVLALDPNADFVYQDLCRACVESGRVDEAIALVAEGLRLKPESAELHFMAGNIQEHERRFDEALQAYDLALELAPNSPEVLSNRGMTLTSLGRYPEALASFEEALRLQPDLGNAHFNEGLCRLLLGEFQIGWRKYEWRWRGATFLASQGADPQRKFRRPQWSGDESLNGSRILLHAEQGLGDTIQFCRYSEVLSGMGATVILEVQPALIHLLADLPGVNQLLAVGQASPDHEFHCPLMSLPFACKTGLDTIPAAGGYLGTSREHRVRADHWHEKLGPRTQPRVGIVWSGSRLHKNDAHRSIPFATFSRIVSDRMEFYCLQNELHEADRQQLADHPPIQLFCEELVDFSETAALVACMDLVVCVDTSVAHLAGAMGKAVWVLLSANPDWRWLLDRDDSPWYRSMRLFRQPTLGDWSSVVATVRRELDRLAEGTLLTAGTTGQKNPSTAR